MTQVNLDALSNPDVSFAGLGLPAQLSITKQIMDHPTQAVREAGMRKLVAKIQADKATGGSGIKTSRDDMKERMALLPDDVQKALIEKRAQISDAAFYFNKAASAVTSKEMIASADAKSYGVTNMDKGQLTDGMWFLLSEIYLLSGVNVTLSNTAYAAVADAIANGELELKVDQRPIMPNISCQVFKRGTAEKIGAYKLDNPKLIQPLKDIRANLFMSEATAANTNIQLVLKGSIIQAF